MRHLIDTTDISVAEVDQIINTALDIIDNRQKYSEVCKGKKLATLFYEPSTRTRLSFTSAMMELGGNVLGFSDAASSSVSKGETVADTVRVLGCFADIIAMRHPKEGAPMVAARKAGVVAVRPVHGVNVDTIQVGTNTFRKDSTGKFVKAGAKAPTPGKGKQPKEGAVMFEIGSNSNMMISGRTSSGSSFSCICKVQFL